MIGRKRGNLGLRALKASLLYHYNPMVRPNPSSGIRLSIRDPPLNRSQIHQSIGEKPFYNIIAGFFLSIGISSLPPFTFGEGRDGFRHG
jgi:hypothetical protein